MSDRVVMDTNVWTSALRSADGAAREVLRLCLNRQCLPLVGQALLAEYEDLMARSELFAKSLLSETERYELLDAFLSVSEWVEVFFLWRPNLRDEGDNHIVELAVAGAASKIITHNRRDFQGGELRFPQLHVLTPAQFLKHWRNQHGDDDDTHS